MLLFHSRLGGFVLLVLGVFYCALTPLPGVRAIALNRDAGSAITPFPGQSSPWNITSDSPSNPPFFNASNNCLWYNETTWGDDQWCDQYVDIFVPLVHLKRLISISEAEYSFTAVLTFSIEWIDDGMGYNAALNATRRTITDPSYTCQRPCNDVDGLGCCDGVWLPQIWFDNMLQLNEGYTTAIVLQPPPSRNGSGPPPGRNFNSWTSTFKATIYTPLNLKSFPFDEQNLILTMRVDTSPTYYARLQPRPAGNIPAQTSYTRSDDVSGWIIKSVEIMPGTNFGFYGEYGRTYQSLAPNQTAVIMIHVSRHRAFYVVALIVPIILITLMGLCEIILPGHALGERMGTVLTLVVTLTALQFVVTATLPVSSYLVPISELILASYCFLAASALKSMLLFHFAYKKHNKKKSREDVEDVIQHMSLIHTELSTLNAVMASGHFTSGAPTIAAPRSRSMPGGGTGGKSMGQPTTIGVFSPLLNEGSVGKQTLLPLEGGAPDSASFSDGSGQGFKVARKRGIAGSRQHPTGNYMGKGIRFWRNVDWAVFVLLVCGYALTAGLILGLNASSAAPCEPVQTPTGTVATTFCDF